MTSWLRAPMAMERGRCVEAITLAAAFREPDHLERGTGVVLPAVPEDEVGFAPAVRVAQGGERRAPRGHPDRRALAAGEWRRLPGRTSSKTEVAPVGGRLWMTPSMPAAVWRREPELPSRSVWESAARLPVDVAYGVAVGDSVGDASESGVGVAVAE